MIDFLLSTLVLTGAIFTFIGSLGLVRLRDFYTRLHGPTKATTLGVGCLLIASALYFSVHEEGVSLHEVLITLFLFITAPVSAHLLAKAALHLTIHSLTPTPPPNPDVYNSSQRLPLKLSAQVSSKKMKAKLNVMGDRDPNNPFKP